MTDINNPSLLFHECILLIERLAEYGLIHGDFNEFNLIYCENYENKQNDIVEEEYKLKQNKIILIDFPQMVSIDHLNADYYFDRDVKCVCDVFKRKFGFIAQEFPTLKDIKFIQIAFL